MTNPITFLLPARLTITVLVLALCACSWFPPRVQPSQEGLSVTLYERQKLTSACMVLSEVSGYGHSEEEARYDLRHNAAVEFNADAVLLNSIEDFYQRKRMINYAREPELTARKGTTDYFYLYPFEFEALGLALSCLSDRR